MGNLKIHIKLVHENIKYPCNQYKAKEKGNPKTHIELVNEKVMNQL